MTRMRFITILGLALAPAAPLPAAVSRCVDLPSCEASLVAMATSHQPGKYGGVPREHFALGAAFAAVEGATPRLVALLAHPDPRVAELAAIALRESTHIDPSQLPALKAGLDRGIRWLPVALAAVPGEASADELVARYMVSRSAPHNQEGVAIERMGARTIPALVRAARCEGGCTADQATRLHDLFQMVGKPLAAAAPELLARASDTATPGDVAALQLALIAAAGAAPRGVESDLLALRDAKPELADDVDDALVGIGAASAGEVFARRLRENPDVMLLQEVAYVGEPARDAAPILVELTNHDDGEIRLLAVIALGEVGGELAIDALIAALREERDLRQPWVAAKALTRWRAASARSALADMASGHPFLTFRALAAQGLQAMDAPQVVASEDVDEDVDSGWLPLSDTPYGDLALPACARPAARVRLPAPGTYLKAGTDDRKLKQLSFDTVVLSYGASDEAEQREKDPDGVVHVHPGNIQETRTPIREVPHVAVRVEDGWIVGTNRGEWGGEIAFVPDKGDARTLARENVRDLHRVGDRIVATTGIAHLSLNQGGVFEVRRGDGGKWRATPWVSLPFVPDSAWPTQDGELWVNVGGGSLLVGPNGRLKPAPCKD